MAGTIEVVGVYPIDTVDAIHMIEVIISDPFDDVDWRAFTQTDTDLVTGGDGSGDDGNEATSHTPQPVEDLPGGLTRVLFFFHDLDLAQPMESPFGAIQLPPPINRPARLDGIDYGPPF
jgi:hypothetical protein